MVEKKQQQQQHYSFNEYFNSPDSKGIEVIVGGVPFRIRRSLTLDEKQRAQDAGVEIEILDGEPNIKRMDQGAYTREVVLMALKSWPFTYDEDYEVVELRGQPVPINRETVSALDEYVAEEIAAKVLRIGEVQRTGLSPFVKK